MNPNLLPLALALAAALLGACASDPAPTPSPPTTPAETGATPMPTAPPTGTPSTLAPTATPSPTSPAGLTWTAAPLPVDAAYSTIGVIDVTVLDGIFLAVGAGWQEDQAGVDVNVPLFWLSSDGREWELVGDGDWQEGYIDAVTTWQGRYLAAGYVGEERASAAFWTSADGRSWERLRDRRVLQFFQGATEGRDIVAGGISYVGGDGGELVARGWLYCACGEEIRDGIVEWRTRDGEEWQRRDLPADEPIVPPIAGGHGWLRISADGGTLESSADGQSWQMAWAPPVDGGEQSTAQLFRLGQRPGGFLVVGALIESGVTTSLALSSTDGLTWTLSTGSAVSQLNGAMVGFAASDSAVVVVGRIGDPPLPHVWLHEPSGATLQRDGA